MNVVDYLIDHEGKDWGELLSGWADWLPNSLTVWLVNLFGDVFLVYDEGSVHMLDIGTDTLTRVADSRGQFFDLMDVAGNGENWLMIPLVDKCRATGLTPSTDQCFGFKIPPLLGGEYVVANVALMQVAAYYSFLADIHLQTKSLPDGAKVRIVVE